MAYREIVTKAVIGKGKKKYKDTYEIVVDNKPSTILGCWIINHNFSAHEEAGKIKIDGSFDANVWYSYDSDTKTAVTNKLITYSTLEELNVPTEGVVNKDIIIRSLKQPTCTSAKEDGNIIRLEIEKELGIEIVGDTKVKISSVDDDDDNWNDLNSNLEKELDKVNPEYINDEVVK